MTFAACAVGALLAGASVMVSVDAFAGLNRWRGTSGLKMVSYRQTKRSLVGSSWRTFLVRGKSKIPFLISFLIPSGCALHAEPSVKSGG